MASPITPPVSLRSRSRRCWLAWSRKIVDRHGSPISRMKITVTHSTVYRYDFPVYLEPHIFRLRPRTNGAQRLLAFDLQIAPRPAGTTECLDQDGTLALNAWFDVPTNELRV